MSLFLTHRQVIEEVRSEANLAKRAGGTWAAVGQELDTHQIAMWASKTFLQVWQDAVVRNMSALERVTDRFTWPADTAEIALAGPPLDAAHPRLTQQPAIVVALYSEQDGTENPRQVEIVDERMVRNGIYSGRGMQSARGFMAAGELAGDRLKMHPANVPSVALRIDYIAWPEALKPESGAPYRGLPHGLLPAAVTQAARELSWWVRGWNEGLDQMAAQRTRSAQRFQLRVERIGPRFINYAYSAFAAA